MYPLHTNINHHVKIGACLNEAIPSVDGYGKEGVYNCYVNDSRTLGNLRTAIECASGWKPIYFWTPGLPSLILPPGIGYQIANPSDEYITMTLQVHYGYLDAHPEVTPVSSGTEGMIMTFAPASSGLIQHSAGLFRTTTFGFLPANATGHAEAACRITEDVILHPFMFSLHAHNASKVISGWKVSPDGKWTLIGKADPLQDQGYYSVRDKDITLTRGDVVAARCTYDVTDDKVHRMYVLWLSSKIACIFVCLFGWFHYQFPAPTWKERTRCVTLLSSSTKNTAVPSSTRPATQQDRPPTRGQQIPYSTIMSRYMLMCRQVS